MHAWTTSRCQAGVRCGCRQTRPSRSVRAVVERVRILPLPEVSSSHACSAVRAQTCEVASVVSGGARLSRAMCSKSCPCSLTLPTDVCVAPWWIDPAPDLEFRWPTIIHVVPGSDATAPNDALFANVWRAASASDRQGLRLEGDPLQPQDPRERLSEPVAPGAIQLPPDGRPIVLLADAQTHGGYPRIGYAIRADWPRLAQLRPGDALRFMPCTQGEARLAWESQAQRLARIALAIAARMP
jgi:hypothetical protein